MKEEKKGKDVKDDGSESKKTPKTVPSVKVGSTKSKKEEGVENGEEKKHGEKKVGTGNKASTTATVSARSLPGKDDKKIDKSKNKKEHDKKAGEEK